MDEAWIQQSLGRLEQLETYKAQVQAGGQAVDLSEVDAEIAALYEVLESAAEGESEARTPEPATPFAAASNPFEQPAYAPPVSPVMQPAPAPMMAPTYDPGMSSTYADVDDAPKSKAPLLAVGALVVIGLAAGGWFVAGRDTTAPAPAAPTGDATVIDASAIPSDTQEPQVAKGGADRTDNGFKIKDSNRPAARGNNDRRGPAPRSEPRPKKPGKEGHKLGIDDSRDPLAGAR